jgi:hypothetical protein
MTACTAPVEPSRGYVNDMAFGMRYDERARGNKIHLYGPDRKTLAEMLAIVFLIAPPLWV